MRLLSFYCILTFYIFLWLQPLLYASSVLLSKWSRGTVCACVCVCTDSVYFPFFLAVCQILPKGVVSVIGPASSPASGSTVSHICGEKEVSGETNTHIWICTNLCIVSTSFSLAYYLSYSDMIMNVSTDLIFLAYCISPHILNHHPHLSTVFSFLPQQCFIPTSLLVLFSSFAIFRVSI